jgi:hypothetical protein
MAYLELWHDHSVAYLTHAYAMSCLLQLITQRTRCAAVNASVQSWGILHELSVCNDGFATWDEEETRGKALKHALEKVCPAITD